jgi:hypothetical protein
VEVLEDLLDGELEGVGAGPQGKGLFSSASAMVRFFNLKVVTM